PGCRNSLTYRPVEPDGISLPERAMIDWARVAELRAEVGEAVFAEVIELFLEEVEAVLDRLNPALPGFQIAEKLHFIKGSALNLGFRQLSDACRGAEEIARRGGAAGPALAQVVAAYRPSREAFLDGLKPGGQMPLRLVG
ncbi:MAG: Hpt domain-containing protein, partial [Qingshengfaniella sp.]